MTKNRTTQKIRKANRLIISEITDIGKQTVRKLGEIIGRSKSTAHRHTQAIKQRNQHPESSQRETEVGSPLCQNSTK